MTISFQIGILYKLMHCFHFYFIKGEKIHVSIGFIFNWYLTPTLYDEKYFILVYVNIFNIGINNLKLVLFSIWYPYCKMSCVYPKNLIIYFQLVSKFTIYISLGIKKRTMFHFLLVSKIYKIFSIGIFWYLTNFVYFQLVS